MTNVEGTTNTQEAQYRNMLNICTKYGFDILIISGSYGGHRRHTTGHEIKNLGHLPIWLVSD